MALFILVQIPLPSPVTVERKENGLRATRRLPPASELPTNHERIIPSSTLYRISRLSLLAAQSKLD